MLPQEILDFWFGEIDPETGMPTEDRYELWFGKSAETDQIMRERFGEALQHALVGEFDDWAQEQDSLVALVVLLDQFSRNIYRGTPQMYVGDEKARDLAKRIIDSDDDAQLPLIYRVFLTMPLMHSEDLQDQEQCVRRFEQLHTQAHPRVKERIAGNLEYAHQHQEIIARYGRFPHRNMILGRKSTPEEEEYLLDPEAGF